jgi:DNA ligase-1
MTKIFKKDSTGKLRSWDFEVEGSCWRTISGLEDGKKVISGWTAATPKNVGKKNATTGKEQALAEALAERTKKLDRDYREFIGDLDAVPPSVMLARNYEDLKHKIEWPVISQPKLDGIRALISQHGAFSREYQPHKNIGHILKALEPVFDAHPDLVLDGELYNHNLRDDFNSISSLVRKEDVTDEERKRAEEVIQFHCYDVVMEKAFTHRISIMATLSGIKFVEIVPTGLCDNQSHLDAFYESYLEGGYEGQMIRSMNAPYESDKRSKHLLKRKETESGEFSISRIIEGKGNWTGYAKAVEYILPEDKRTEKGERPKAGIKGERGPFAKQLLTTVFSEKATVTIEFKKPTPAGIPRFPIVVDFHPNGRKD